MIGIESGAGMPGPSGVRADAHPGAGEHRESWFARHIRRRIDAVSLGSKLVACIIVLLTLGSFALSFSIRQLVSSYMMEKIDTQLINQAELVFNNIELLRQSSGTTENSPSMTSYFLQARDKTNGKTENLLVPALKGGVDSVPVLPRDDSGVTFGQPFTTAAAISFDADSASASSSTADHATLSRARSPWRVVAMRWVDKTTDGDSYVRGVIYVGLSLSDSIDTTNTLTRYSAMVGIAVVLLGGVIGSIVVSATLTPLKRIEKTAAKIAAGDLSQRVPSAPENTEVGSLSASLNAMLARIEQSFREQQETTDKMKRFVSDASHELRTPLAAIHGYAELYKMQREFPGALERADESIAHIEASSSRMTVLVEDLLSLARLDEGRGIDLTQQVPLTAVVSDATDDLHALDPERGIRVGSLELEPSSDGSGSRFAFREGAMPDVTLSGDGSRLRQVVTNIVGNIHRYTPADSPVEAAIGVLPASISPESLSRMPSTETSLRHLIEAIEVGQSMQVGMNYAIVRFSDHGPGVPEESRSQIFERFYTADPSRARLKGGTGLGMAIAQSVVKAHRGFICATQTDGGGLTLTVVLPVAPVEPKIEPVPAETAKRGWMTKSDSRTAKSERRTRQR
ncbi:sensor histidine kinase [Bifidobacterium samirii]|uniref:histidine kinase n=1 Tax=Bifidobacterium samirii TaxID=2306974 RepID=A0A430FPC9_9BIFI|nr:HAMP domain-containing sensor histidine kinase [Bifidobacterium samirii]RSX54681.1 sensor histidine kinase [Bifidobacterium samirii]